MQRQLPMESWLSHLFTERDRLLIGFGSQVATIYKGRQGFGTLPKVDRMLA